VVSSQNLHDVIEELILGILKQRKRKRPNYHHHKKVYSPPCQKTKHTSDQNTSNLVVHLLVHNTLGLLLLGAEEPANGLDDLGGNDERRRQQRLAVGDQVVAADLLDLAAVRLEHVVLAGQAGPIWEEDEVAGLLVDLAGGLFDYRKARVDGRERLVAQVVGLLDVGGDVLVRLGEVGDYGLGEGLVGRVAELEGLLAVGVGLEGLEAVVDYWVVEEVVDEGRVWHIAIDLW